MLHGYFKNENYYFATISRQIDLFTSYFINFTHKKRLDAYSN